jgi:hypothetical protein
MTIQSKWSYEYTLSRYRLVRAAGVRFGLVTGFVGHLQLVIKIHYGAMDNSNILQFTSAANEPSRSAVSSPVFW